MSVLKALANGFVRLFSSLGLSAALIMTLALLTWLGTLAQVHTSLYDVVRTHFNSLWFFHQAGPIRIPLPGAASILALLSVNLIVGGLVRLRKSRDMLGIGITHIGILMLIASGAGKLWLAKEGHVTLYEGESDNRYLDFHEVEIAIREYGEGGSVTERAISSPREV